VPISPRMRESTVATTHQRAEATLPPTPRHAAATQWRADEGYRRESDRPAWLRTVVAKATRVAFRRMLVAMRVRLIASYSTRPTSSGPRRRRKASRSRSAKTARSALPPGRQERPSDIRPGCEHREGVTAHLGDVAEVVAGQNTKAGGNTGLPLQARQSACVTSPARMSPLARIRP